MAWVQKPHVTRMRSVEESIWKSQHLLLPKFSIMMWRNADKTFSKCGFSALSLRHENHFSPELESWKYEFGVVNSLRCQNCERVQEMLTKPSQRKVSVLCAFGTETTFVWNQKFARMKMERSTCCCENFGQWCEEMLTKPSQSMVSVLYAFGTESTFGRN